MRLSEFEHPVRANQLSPFGVISELTKYASDSIAIVLSELSCRLISVLLAEALTGPGLEGQVALGDTAAVVGAQAVVPVGPVEATTDRRMEEIMGTAATERAMALQLTQPPRAVVGWGSR